VSQPTKLPVTADAWAELRRAVHAFISGRVHDAHAADDIAQDVMLKVQTSLVQRPPAERFGPWVFQIARNAIVDQYRSRRSAVDRQDVDVAVPDEGTGAAAELSACVSAIIDRLPEPYRTALALADIEGLKHQEVADRTGVSLTAAKSRVQRGREKFQTMLLDCCHIERNAAGGVVDYQTTPRSSGYCGDALPGDSCR